MKPIWISVIFLCSALLGIVGGTWFAKINKSISPDFVYQGAGEQLDEVLPAEEKPVFAKPTEVMIEDKVYQLDEKAPVEVNYKAFKTTLVDKLVVNEPIDLKQLQDVEVAEKQICPQGKLITNFSGSAIELYAAWLSAECK